jgi:hypothetical protein
MARLDQAIGSNMMEKLMARSSRAMTDVERATTDMGRVTTILETTNA